MNDRFAAQLRQHLLDTADPRPADGQLASVIDGVAATAQRHPLAARLTWDPERIGRLPSTALRYGLIAAALALAAVAGGILAAGASQPSTVFEGTWTTIDPVDGSGMTLVVGRGPSPDVYFEDGFASGEACVDDAVRRFTARGTGDITDDRLVATFPDGGGCGLATVGIGGSFVHDPASDTITDQDGLVWIRALGDPPETPAPSGSPVLTASPGPTASPATPPADTTTFTSTWHGFSIDLPADWRIRRATEPWSGEPLSVDSPAADVAVDPGLDGDRYVLMASQPYGDLDQDAWRDHVHGWLCGDHGGSFWSSQVDGFPAWGRECGLTSVTLVFTETRGYVFAAVGWDDGGWLSEGLETVDLRPDDALALATPVPDPDCLQFDAPGTYSAPVGPLTLTVDMPGTPGEPWNGHRDEFDVVRASCTDWMHPGGIDAGEVTFVDPTACTGGAIAVKTTAEAVATVSAAQGIDVVEQTDVAIDGYPGTWFVIRVDEAPNACRDGQIPLVDGVNPMDRGVSVGLYLIDVDGTILALGLFSYQDWDPAMRTAADGIIASLQIDR